MPMTKYQQRLEAQAARYDPLLELITGRMTVRRINTAEIAIAAGFKCQASWYRRIKSPWEFTIGELEGIAHKLDIPWADITDKLLCAGKVN